MEFECRPQLGAVRLDICSAERIVYRLEQLSRLPDPDAGRKK
jgi:hypothetical protein